MNQIKWIVLLLLIVSFTQTHAQQHDKGEDKTVKFQKLSFGGSISGRLIGQFIDKDSKLTKKMGIPKTQVQLKSSETGKIIKESLVDIQGYFRFSRLDAGKYQICWERKGFGQSCEEAVEVKNKALFILPIQMNKNSLILQDLVAQQIDPDLLSQIRDLFAGSSTDCKTSTDIDRFLFRKRNDNADDNSEGGRSEIIGEAYYNKIDPNNRKLTLGDWWRLNGFDPFTGRAPAENNGFQAAAVAYLNDNDLGFGRNMHCLKKSSTSFACWVANHGAADQDPANADLAAGYINPGATVTMEFSPFGSQVFRKVPDFSTIGKLSDLNLKSSSRLSVDKQISDLSRFNKADFINQGVIQALLGDPTVKFYVYDREVNNAGQVHADFGRTTKANLDGCEVRHVPGLCLNCHGGAVPNEIFNGTRDNWTSTDIREVGAASFREFDTATFKYPGGRTNTNNVEDATFKRLNKLIVNNTNPSDAIDELIENWYSSADDTSIDENYVPDSWSAPVDHSDAYVDVVGRACRTCHIALDEIYNWDDKTNLDNYGSFLSSYICGNDADMPHAKVTTDNLTLSQRNTLLGVYGSSCP